MNREAPLNCTSLTREQIIALLHMHQEMVDVMFQYTDVFYQRITENRTKPDGLDAMIEEGVCLLKTMGARRQQVAAQIMGQKPDTVN